MAPPAPPPAVRRDERRLVRGAGRDAGRPRRDRRCSCARAPRKPARHRARFDIALPDALGFDWPDWPVVSPTAQHLVFTARLQGRRQLWMRSLDGIVQPLADTEGCDVSVLVARQPARRVLLRRQAEKVDVAGGPVTVLSDAYSVSRGAWGPTGRSSSCRGRTPPSTRSPRTAVSPRAVTHARIRARAKRATSFRASCPTAATSCSPRPARSRGSTRRRSTAAA